MSQQFSMTPFDGGRILRHLATDPLSTPPPTPFSPSLTYELYYGLKEKPFSLSADPRFLYRGPTHAPAFDELLNGIRRRDGLIVLTGEIGTGKTTLIRSVLQHLDRRTFSAFVPDPFVSREDVLKMLLVDFGVVSIADLKRGSLRGTSRPDLTYPLYEFLDSLVPLQAFAVAIFDEAQNLPLQLIEEIRILSDLEGREKLLQVVLVGQPELRDHLKLPEMRQVDQRISVRCELAPLGPDAIADYVRHRLNIAGDGDCRVEFTASAIEVVYHASGGTPRVINKICDRSLARGHASCASCIEADVVVQAVRDLGLQPVPSPRTIVEPDQTIASTNAPEAAPPGPVEETRVAPDSPPSPPVAIIAVEKEPHILSEFTAERDLARAVPMIIEPKSSWKLTGVAMLLAFIVAVGTLVLLMAASYDVDISVMILPPAPARAPLPTLAVPTVPAPWVIPTDNTGKPVVPKVNPLRPGSPSIDIPKVVPQAVLERLETDAQNLR